MKVLTLLLISSLLLFAACGGDTYEQAQEADVTDSPTPGVESSLTALQESETVECISHDGEGGMVTMYLDSGELRRALIQSVEGTVHIVVDDEAMYQWIEGAPNGIMMSTEQEEAFFDRWQDSMDEFAAEYDVAEEMEPYEVEDGPVGDAPRCRVFEFPAGFLDLPSDVSFVAPPTMEDIDAIEDEADLDALMAELEQQYGT